MRWPWPSVLGEAWRGRHRILVWTGVPFGLLLVALMIAEIIAGTQLWDAEQRRQDRGGDVLQVAYDPPLNDAGPCLRLARWPAIEQAGTIGLPVGRSRAGFSVHPNAEAEVLQVTPGALSVLTGNKPVSVDGLVVGADLAGELGVRPGNLLQPQGAASPVEVVDVVNTAARFPQHGRVLYHVVARPARTRQCLVQTRPHLTEPVRDTLAAIGLAAGNGAEVQLIASTDLEDALAAYRARPSRYGWVVVAAATGLFALAAAWFGRAGAGLYRALGMTRTELAIMALVRAAIAVVPTTTAMLLGAWAWISHIDTVARPSGLWQSAATQIALAALATLILVALATVLVAGRHLADLIRTRL